MNMAIPQRLEFDSTMALEQPKRIRPSTWSAYLHLSFAQRARGVRLVETAHEGPLYVQKAFYPEGDQCAHCYLLHPPGGLVTGDDLSVSVQVQANAHALVTTPGAGRVYKQREQGGVQSQKIHLNVAEQACLEWLPLETILFPNSHARLNSRIDLAEGAKVIAWDVTCFGLPANGITFDEGSVDQHLQVWQAGRIKLNERLVLDLPLRQPKHGQETSASLKPTLLTGNAGLRARPVHGLLIAGPFNIDQQHIDDLIEQLRAIQPRLAQEQAAAVFSVTQNGAFLVARYLGWCTESAHHCFRQAWQALRPVLMRRSAVPPRIWAT